MPAYTEFEIAQWSDGVLTVALNPPFPVGGVSIIFTMSKRDGGSPLVSKVCNSGYGAGQSGIIVTNSGQGKMSVIFSPPEVSGLSPGAYQIRMTALISGKTVPVLQGYRRMP